jgi:hypothetical protein
MMGTHSKILTIISHLFSVVCGVCVTEEVCVVCEEVCVVCEEVCVVCEEVCEMCIGVRGVLRRSLKSVNGLMNWSDTKIIVIVL